MCQAPVIVSVATEVGTSCDAVWHVIANIEMAPTVVTQVVSVERLSNEHDFREGTRWKETRNINGKMVQIKTVTSIRMEEGGGKSVAINVSAEDDKYLTNTCTLEVQPISGVKDKCILIGSFGAESGGIRGRIVFFLCGRRLASLGSKFMLEELEEIGTAAVKQSHKHPLE